LRELLTSGRHPNELCEEMKQRCYQRGAEDNLTAVVVQVGTPRFEAVDLEEETTVSRERFTETLDIEPPPVAEPPSGLVPPSRIAFPATTVPQRVQTTQAKSGGARAVLRFFVFLLFVGAVGAAFYGGMIYQRQRHSAATDPSNQPSPPPAESTIASKRAAVDANPQEWLSNNASSLTNWKDSKDAEFLYLFGRASMLTGNQKDAMQAFELALNNLRSESKNSLPLATEVKLANAAAGLKMSKGGGPSQEALMAEDKAISVLDEILGLKSQAPPK